MAIRSGSGGALLLVTLVCLTLAPVSASFGQAPAATDEDGQTDVVSIGNTTEQLEPARAGDSRQGYGNASVDVAGAVAVDAERLRADHSRAHFDALFAGAEDRVARLALIRDRLRTSERQIQTLRTEHRSVRAAYSRSDISTRTFLRKTARTQAAMERHQRLLEQLQRHLTTVSNPPTVLQRRIANVEGSLLSLGGPVSETIRDGVSGQAQPNHVYVSTEGETGYVFATVNDGQLSRQAYDATARNPGGTDEYGGGRTSDVRDRIETLYPWSYDNRISEPPIGGFGNSSIYWVALDHAHGDLRTYVDGATTDVFRELQQKRAGAVPVSATATNETADLALTVEATGATGPMAVSLTAGPGGDPVDGTVYVDGQPVGTTGGTGQLWVVQPTGQFTVAAEHDGSRVTVVP